MAIAVNGGHVSRALDFYDAEGKYFIIGGTTPWEDDSNPTPPDVDDFKLRDVVGLKKIDNTYLVVPDNEAGTISYRSQKWRVVPRDITTTAHSEIVLGATEITVDSVAGLTVGAKLRINNEYEGKITELRGAVVTLDTPAPVYVPAGSPIIGGALVEVAKYVYVEAFLNYDEFPLVTYRQIGLCTGVLPNDKDIMREATYSPTSVKEYSSLGNLEVLDNRAPMTRDIAMRELISLVFEF